AIKSLRPAVRVIGVQADALPGMKRALETGTRVTLPPASTIADGIAVRQVGELTLSLAARWVHEVVTVTEEELANAVSRLGETEVELTLETTGRKQIDAIKQRLVEAGYRVDEPRA